MYVESTSLGNSVSKNHLKLKHAQLSAENPKWRILKRYKISQLQNLYKTDQLEKSIQVQISHVKVNKKGSTKNKVYINFFQLKHLKKLC